MLSDSSEIFWIVVSFFQELRKLLSVGLFFSSQRDFWKSDASSHGPTWLLSIPSGIFRSQAKNVAFPGNFEDFGQFSGSSKRFCSFRRFSVPGLLYLWPDILYSEFRVIFLIQVWISRNLVRILGQRQNFEGSASFIQSPTKFFKFWPSSSQVARDFQVYEQISGLDFYS